MATSYERIDAAAQESSVVCEVDHRDSQPCSTDSPTAPHGVAGPSKGAAKDNLAEYCDNNPPTVS